MERSGRVRWAIVAAAFFAVLREGLEAALFLDRHRHHGGRRRGAARCGVIGLAVACVLGWAVVLGGKRLPMKRSSR